MQMSEFDAVPGQTRTWSAVESGATMIVGYVVAIVFYQAIWPMFGYEVKIMESAAVALLMFPINYGRQYAVRRFFNWIQQNGKKQINP